MKRILSFAALAIALIYNTAQAEKAEGVDINRTAQAINFTQSIDMTKYRTAGVQAVYADGTPGSHTLTSGSKQSGSITVTNDYAGLTSAQASVTVSVRDVSGASGDTVRLNGINFTEGVHWTAVTSTITSASNLKTVIDAHPEFVATVAGSTVTVKYVTYGTSGNGLPVATTDSTNLAIGASTFAGGVNQYTVTINGVVLTEGTDFVAQTSSRTTAGNLTTAINGNATLSAQVTASSGTTSSVITVTALYPGANSYFINTSTTGFAISAMTVGSASDISIADDVFTKSSHGLSTGLKVRYDTASGTAPGGLTTGTTYYAIKLNESRYKVATSSTLAVAGTAVDITSLPTTVASYTMTPPALSVGGAGFYWQASNDNSNFASLSSISSVTYSSAGTTLWEFSPFPYKYLRMNFTGPTNGGLNVTTTIIGIEE